VKITALKDDSGKGEERRPELNIGTNEPGKSLKKHKKGAGPKNQRAKGAYEGRGLSEKQKSSEKEGTRRETYDYRRPRSAEPLGRLCTYYYNRGVNRNSRRGLSQQKEQRVEDRMENHALTTVESKDGATETV